MSYSYWTLAFPAVTIICLLLFFYYYLKVSRPLLGTTEWISEQVKTRRFCLSARRHPMVRRDILPLLLITVVYGLIAFFSLGSTEAPQSFYRFTDEEPSVTLTLSEETEIGSLMYYTGLWTGHYTLQFSPDGVNWTEQVAPEDDDEDDDYAMDQAHSDLFKWLSATLNEDGGRTKYIRMTAGSKPMELGEIALYDGDGNLIPSDTISAEPAALSLFDEQAIIPDTPSYLSNMYFDEIYHGRTAYEHINNVYPYEITHPPLGKLIISLGIRMFGMTPFGWRFMGTLFGILMLPLLYVFLKNMFGKTIIASCGTILFAADFMHFVQTRIATIDTYGVFFILLMYFFMYRYMTQDYESPLKKTLLPLALSGLAFGLGCASKWTCVYAGAGLAVLLFLHLFLRGKHSVRENGERQPLSFVVRTLLFSLVFFVIVPAVIYCLSYIPYGLARGMTVGSGMLWNGDFLSADLGQPDLHV